MPRLKFRDDTTGKTVAFDWAGAEPPTEAELDEIFAEAKGGAAPSATLGSMASAAGKGFMQNVPALSDIEQAAKGAVATPLGMGFGLDMAKGAVQEAQGASQAQFAQGFDAKRSPLERAGRFALGVVSSLPMVGPPVARMAENMVGGIASGDGNRFAEGVGEAAGAVTMALAPAVAARGVTATRRIKARFPTKGAASQKVLDDLSLTAPPHIDPTEVGESVRSATKVSSKASRAEGSRLYKPIDDAVEVPVSDIVGDPEILTALQRLPVSTLKKDFPALLQGMEEAAWWKGKIPPNAPALRIPFSEADRLHGWLAKKSNPKGGGIPSPEEAALSRAAGALDEKIKGAAEAISPELRGQLDLARENYRSTVGDLFNAKEPGAAIIKMRNNPEGVVNLLLSSKGKPAPATVAFKVKQILDQGEMFGGAEGAAASQQALLNIQNQIIHQHVLRAPDGGAFTIEGAAKRIKALGPVKDTMFAGDEVLNRLALIDKTVQAIGGVKSPLGTFLHDVRLWLWVTRSPVKFRMLLKGVEMFERGHVGHQLDRLMRQFQDEMRYPDGPLAITPPPPAAKAPHPAYGASLALVPPPAEP